MKSSNSLQLDHQDAVACDGSEGKPYVVSCSDDLDQHDASERKEFMTESVSKAPNAVPLFLTDKQFDPLIAPLIAEAIDQEHLKKARRLERIEKMLNSHQRNKFLTLAFLTIVLALLFVVELTYSMGQGRDWQLTLLK